MKFNKFLFKRIDVVFVVGKRIVIRLPDVDVNIIIGILLVFHTENRNFQSLNYGFIRILFLKMPYNGNQYQGRDYYYAYQYYICEISAHEKRIIEFFRPETCRRRQEILR